MSNAIAERVSVMGHCMEARKSAMVLMVAVVAAIALFAAPSIAYAETQGDGEPGVPAVDVGAAPDGVQPAGAHVEGDGETEASGGGDANETLGGAEVPGSGDNALNGEDGNAENAGDGVSMVPDPDGSAGDGTSRTSSPEDGMEANDDGTGEGVSQDAAAETGSADSAGQDSEDADKAGGEPSDGILAGDADGLDGAVADGSPDDGLQEGEAPEGLLADQEGDAALEPEGEALATLTAATAVTDLEAADAGAQNAADAAESDAKLKSAGVGDEPSAEDLLTLVQKLVASAVTGDPLSIASTAVDWTLGELFKVMFGTPVKDEEAALLEDILENIAEIQKQLDTLQTTVDSAELNHVLDQLRPLLAEQTTLHVLNALKGYDDDLKNHKTTKEKAAEGRLSTLTDDLHITKDVWGAVDNHFDLYVQYLWSAMTTPWPVAQSGSNPDMTLMEIYYEHLRKKYHWENQAYEEWSAFQSQCVGLLTTSLVLEKASLQARIHLINTYGMERDIKGITSLLAQTQDHLNELAGYKGKNWLGKDVDYPGTFSEKTWESQYWMYKERPEYRYYWKPGHEVLFYNELTTQVLPGEDLNAGLSTGGLRGVYVQWYQAGSGVDYNVGVNYLYYWDFLTYNNDSAKNVQLASADQLMTIFKDYGSSMHLDKIFMDKNQGNFNSSAKHDYGDWRFIVCADEHHSLAYDKRTDKADVLYIPVIAPWGKQEFKDLWYYRFKSTEQGSTLHFVGVGIARVGPEDPNGGNHTVVPVPSQLCTTVTYPRDWALWWPSHGDLPLGVGQAMQGSLKAVYLDGLPLSAASYTAGENQLVLSQTALAGLGFGEHELVFKTEKGTHSIVFSTQADGVYRAVSGSGSARNAGSDSSLTFIFKRTVNDAQTFGRLIGVLVDGAAVPAWGFTVQAGSAIVTLTAEFLDTLAPGKHTLTAQFADGNDPQATFTVRTSPADYDAGEEAGGAPGLAPTGDSAPMLMIVLAMVAACAAGVVLFALRQRSRGSR